MSVCSSFTLVQVIAAADAGAAARRQEVKVNQPILRKFWMKNKNKLLFWRKAASVFSQFKNKIQLQQQQPDPDWVFSGQIAAFVDNLVSIPFPHINSHALSPHWPHVPRSQLGSCSHRYHENQNKLVLVVASLAHKQLSIFSLFWRFKFTVTEMMLWMFSCWPGLGRDSRRGETSLQINERSAAAAAAEPESEVRSSCIIIRPRGHSAQYSTI